MIDLEFTELDPPREITATPSELRTLRRARHGLRIEELGDDRVRVGPRIGYAGTVLLPTGRRIVVMPKAPISNLPELLALAYRAMALPLAAGAAAIDEAIPTDWLLLQLIGEIEELLSRGLRRGYVERRELLAYVRGRLRPQLNPARLPFADCEYSDFVSDTAENRLLRGVLEFLAPAASNPIVRRRMGDALAAFAGVSLVRPSLVAFDRVAVTRLNAHYQPSLRLARIALEGAGVHDAVGASTAPAYFVPMWRVWEAAVASALRDAGIQHVHEQPEFADRFVQQGGYPKLRVTLRPDLLIGYRGTPALAIDLKWAPALELRYGKKRLRNQHLYQLATYCAALRCDGLLVYPEMEDQIDSMYEFNGRTIRIRTVNLATPSLADLRSFAVNLAEKMAEPGMRAG